MNKTNRAIGVLGQGVIAGLGLVHSGVSAAPISVEQIGGERMAGILAHEVREAIAGNPVLRVGADSEEGWKLVLLTSGEEGEPTFYSVVLVRKRFADVFDQYVFAFSGTCTREQLKACARDIVGKVEEPIARFETDWRDQSVPAAEVADAGAATASD